MFINRSINIMQEVYKPKAGTKNKAINKYGNLTRK